MGNPTFSLALNGMETIQMSVADILLCCLKFDHFFFCGTVMSLSLLISYFTCFYLAHFQAGLDGDFFFSYFNVP